MKRYPTCPLCGLKMTEHAPGFWSCVDPSCTGHDCSWTVEALERLGDLRVEWDHVIEKAAERRCGAPMKSVETLLFDLRDLMAVEWTKQHPTGKLPDRIGWALQEALRVFQGGRPDRTDMHVADQSSDNNDQNDQKGSTP